jgi:hypothetical protein
MDQPKLCKYCDQPCKPRHDRPGKFFTLCVDHYAEYQRQKNKESYDRHQKRRRQDAKRKYWRDPEKARATVRRSLAKPEVHERKRAYMRLYNFPYRIHLKDTCEKCGYQSQAEDRRDLDIHHLDDNHNNNDPANLQTLCPTCHRLLP